MTSFQPLVVDLAVKGTLLLLLAFGAAVLLRRSSAAARHLHWQLVLAGLLTLPLLAAVTPRVAVPAGPLAAWLAPAGRQPVVEPDARAAATSERAHPDPSARRVDEDRPVREQPVASPSAAPLVGPSPASSAPARSAVREAAPRRPAFTFYLALSPLQQVLAVWGAGAALVLALLAVGLLRARALSRRATPVTDPEWLALSDRVRRELSLRRAIDLRRVPDALVPMTFGWRRPVVLLPSDADHWEPSRRRHVLLHELAHVRRGDWAGQLVAQAACALWWWQPLVWLAARELRRQRELACDDAVLVAGSRASEYADHLLAIAATRSGRRTSGVATLAMARRGQLEGRLLAVLDAARRRRAPGPRRALLAAGVAAALVTVLACVQPKAEETAVNDAGTAITTSQDGHFSITHDGRSVEGTVVDESGEPVPGATVTIDVDEDTGGLRLRFDGADDDMTLHAQELSFDGRRLRVPAPEAALAPQALPGPEGTPAPDTLAPLAITVPEGLGRSAPLTLNLSGLSTALRPLAQIGYLQVSSPRRVSFSHIVNDCGDDSVSIWSFSEDDDQYSVIVKGCVVPDETGTHVGWIDEDGSFAIDHVHGDVEDHVEATCNEEGEVVWTGHVGGQDLTGEAARLEADKLMAVALARTGLFASERVNSLVEQGGTSGAVAALGAMPADHGRLEMLSALLTEHELETDEFADALKLAAEGPSADAEMSEILSYVGADALGDPDLVETVFAATESIESDAYEAEILSSLLSAQDADAPVLARGLRAAANGIESDAYMAEVLQQVPPGRLRDADVREAFVAGLASIESDAYAAEVIVSLPEARGLKGESLAAIVIAGAQGIDSDAYMAEVLQCMPARARSDAGVRDALISALGTIESDAYAAEVASCWLGDGARAEFTAALLGAAGQGIDSDTYLADVLQSVPDELLTEPAVRSAYETALGSIESRSYAEEARERLGSEE